MGARLSRIISVFRSDAEFGVVGNVPSSFVMGSFGASNEHSTATTSCTGAARVSVGCVTRGGVRWRRPLSVGLNVVRYAALRLGSRSGFC